VSYSGTAALTFNNAGSFIRSGSGTTTFDSKAAFSNTGSVNVAGGTLQFSNTYTQTAGSTVLNGGGLSGPVNIQGGSLYGAGTIAGNVTNAGQLSPGASVGAVGTLQISGSYTQQPGGALNLEIAGDASYDVLQVTGTATLAGTLNVTRLGSYVAALGRAFPVLTYAGRSGDFTTTTGLDAGGGGIFQPSFGGTAFNLTVGAPVPAIGSLSPSWVMAGSGAFLLTVNGTGFVLGSAVLWNGAVRPTNFVGTTQLTATISTDDVASAGQVAISVQNPAPGGGLSNSLAFFVTSGFALATNLLVNPGAEAGAGTIDGMQVLLVPGWTTSGNFTVANYGAPTSTGAQLGLSDPGPADRGTNFFVGGPDNSSSSAAQVIDLFAGAATIDTGTLGYTLSGWLGGWGAQDDSAVLTATFKDGSGTTLGSASIGPVLGADRQAANGLLFRSTAGMLPAGTRTVQVTLMMTRTSGAFNDGYADSLMFKVNGAYSVGDVFPFTGDAAGQFGDGALNNLDLVHTFRAATNPELAPAACSDRYDAMDVYPADSAVSVGGDGVLDIMDLSLLLDRAVGFDVTRPMRAGRVAACPASAGFQLFARIGRGGTAAWTLDANLESGTPAPAAAGVWRVPIYLRANVPLDLLGIGYSVSVEGYTGSVRFVSGSAPPPSLVDSGLPGMLAVAWLNGLKLAAGDQLLLGYAEVSGGQAPALRFNGAIANARDGRRVTLGLPDVPARPAQSQ
jgi:hypothetical protein